MYRKHTNICNYILTNFLHETMICLYIIYTFFIKESENMKMCTKYQRDTKFKKE